MFPQPKPTRNDAKHSATNAEPKLNVVVVMCSAKFKELTATALNLALLGREFQKRAPITENEWCGTMWGNNNIICARRSRKLKLSRGYYLFEKTRCTVVEIGLYRAVKQRVSRCEMWSIFLTVVNEPKACNETNVYLILGRTPTDRIEQITVVDEMWNS